MKSLEIARRHKTALPTVYRWVKEAGLLKRQRQFNEAEKRHMALIAWRSNESVKAVAARLDVSPTHRHSADGWTFTQRRQRNETPD